MNLKSDVRPEDAARIEKEFDDRHGLNDPDTPKSDKHKMTQEEKLAVDNNNRIGEICLFGNALSSAFNLLGVCVVATASLVSPLDANVDNLSEEELDDRAAQEIGRLFSLQMFIFGILSSFMMNLIYSKRKYPWQQVMDPGVSNYDRLMMLAVGLMFSVVQWLSAGYIGPELPCLLSGVAAFVLFVLMEKGKSIYKREWPTSKNRRYLIPFVLLMGILLFIRLVPYVEYGLTGEWDDTAQDVMAPKLKLGGYSKVDFPWLTHSGIIVSLIAISIPFIVPFYEPDHTLKLDYPVCKDGPEIAKALRQAKFVAFSVARFKKPLLFKKKKVEKRNMIKTVIKECFLEAFHESQSVLISITAFASMAKLMASFEMTQTIALTFVDGLSSTPSLYAFFIPFIGMLGSGLTGSTTTSNFLFARLQVNTAINLNLIRPGHNSIYEITAAQMLGSTAGEIISPMNAIVITLMRGVDKKESDLIKDLLPIAIMWMLLACVVSALFILPEGFID